MTGIRILFVLCLVSIYSGCIPNVNIPAADQFNVRTSLHSGNVKVAANEKQLLSDLFTLLKSNEAVKIPICEASKAPWQCIKNGVKVFVLGGVIPGVGKREFYLFKDVSLQKNRIDFIKDNSSTTFIGTPMYTKENKCQVFVKHGGLQVEMTKYYANWAGIGNMTMAEGWMIDHIDLEQGVVGLQLELDISGFVTIGGGSKYVLLKFPNIPAALSSSATEYTFLE